MTQLPVFKTAYPLRSSIHFGIIALMTSTTLSLPAQAESPDLSHRQSQLSFVVEEPDGTPIPDAEVHIEMINPAFRWGTLQSYPPFRPGADATSVIRRKIERHHNSVTFGNDLKWGNFENQTPEETRNRILAVTRLVPAFGVSDSFRKRGHTTIWSNQAPSDINQSTDPEYLKERIYGHIEEYFTRLAPYIRNYDLYNEPGNARSLIQKIFPGSGYPDVSQEEIDEIAKWFQMAAEIQPDAQLFINEYNILNDWNQNDQRVHDYKAFIDRIRDAGGPIGGIGLQAHIDRYISYEQFVRRIAIMTADMEPTANHPEGLPGLPVEITELDINPNVVSQEQEREIIDSAIRAAFENPMVQGVSNSGIWDGSHWRGNGVIYDVDWNVKPSGESWIERVHQAYWTSESTRSDQNGAVDMTVFKGLYRISVRSESMERSFEVDVSTDIDTVLTMQPPPPAETYSEWLDHFYYTDVDSMRQRSDPDGDDIDNFAEFLLGTHPFLPESMDQFLALEQTAEDTWKIGFKMRTSMIDAMEKETHFSDLLHFAIWRATTEQPSAVDTVSREDGHFTVFEAEVPQPSRNTFYRLQWMLSIPEED